MQCVFGEEMGLGAACYILYPFYGNILACVPMTVQVCDITFQVVHILIR